MNKLPLLATSLLLSACQMVGPDYHLPAQAAFNRDDLQGVLRADADSVVSAPVPADWWRLYRD
ncbi:MAG: TolC family protein, partial [Pseudomonas sp.]|nr:TolC family protein [Pseudomonas sp.]